MVHNSPNVKRFVLDSYNLLQADDILPLLFGWGENLTHLQLPGEVNYQDGAEMFMILLILNCHNLQVNLTHPSVPVQNIKI